MAYGKHVHIGDGFYANFNLVLVDDGDIYIGDNVMIAPNVTISPTGHPVHPDLRRGGTQFSFPVRIGDDVWIGANVVILPGISIGKNSVIGVTRDIPENVVAVGNPCRVLRPINERDREYYYRDKRCSLQEYEDQMLSKSCARNDRSTICSGACPKRL
jgi:galactoside O-acetyltransferase